ncbi:MAG: helix-turn-helix transcriptional regulator [Candidatus Levybacteria bacterium]|nr:helix-turn-helix transcriptional regulator [Candidatus Levybacteria bacterium]
MKINAGSVNHKEKEELQGKFGKRLAELRSKKGFTQENFSFEAGVDRTYISYIERGKRNPSLYMLWKTAKALNVKLSDLLSF